MRNPIELNPSIPKNLPGNLDADDISLIGSLSAIYLPSDAIEFSEEDLAANLLALLEISKQTPAKISKRHAGQIQKLALSANIRAHSTGRFAARHTDGDGGGKAGIGLSASSRSLKTDEPTQARNQMLDYVLSRLRDKSITYMAFMHYVHPATRAILPKACNESPLREFLKQSDVLKETGNRDAGGNMYFSTNQKQPIQAESSSIFEKPSPGNYVILQPVYRSVQKEVVIRPKSLFKAAQTEMRASRELDETRKCILMQLLSADRGGGTRIGTWWWSEIECTNEVAKAIFDKVSKSPEALFQFFVDVVPGFKELSGTDFQAYYEASKKNTLDGKPEFKVAVRESSSSGLKFL